MNPRPCAQSAALCLLAALVAASAIAQNANDGFDPNVTGFVRTLAVQADGRIIIGGTFTQVQGMACSNLARLTLDGALDTNFTAQADGDVHCLAVQSNGWILVGGDFTQLGGQPRARLGRLSPDGSPDLAFRADANG